VGVRGLASPVVRPAQLSRRLYADGWVLLPLRAFLGGTFVYAGLQKLADHHFFDPASPSSVQAQMRVYARRSPIGSLLLTASHHGVLVGLAIALGELAVGLGALLGLWTRVAAAAGMLLAAFFLLAVSWHSSPYYYGPDIVFLFAWTPLLLAGAGAYSLDSYLQRAARQELRLPPTGLVTIEFAAVRALCGSYDAGRCRRLNGRPCDSSYCPVLESTSDLRPTAGRELDRRTFLRQAAAAGEVGAGALALGGVLALAGRAFGSSSPSRSTTPALGTIAPTTAAPGTAPTADPSITSTQSSTSGPTSSVSVPATSPLGSPIGTAASVPVGGAASFSDPTTGDPAFVVQPTAAHFAAFSAICTHQGCPVDFQPASGTTPGSFVCPCHGAVFDATNGTVLQGPARTPLPGIKVTAGPDGQLYVQR
jgi:thiosulfate dehydrogenase (quinone) large subunit